MSLLSRLLIALLVVAIGGFGLPSRAAEPSKDPIPMAQIEQMVAPIALYPDALLTQILMASTYPLDLVMADRWLEEHPDLKGEDLDKAVRGEPWDESIKVLVQFPSVLGFMSDNLDWTQDLGDAVLGQMQDLVDAIQKLRREAELAGNLKSNDKQRVEKAGDTIVIQPASAETVYVPAYDPAKVYGQTTPPATNYYPAVYTDAAYGYATTQPVSTPVVTTDSSYNEGLIGFGAGALVGGLLTAAILWDNHNDPIYWGGPGRWGGGSYWSQPNYWHNNGWRSANNISINRDIDRNRVNTGDINVNRGISGNEINRWNHNPERRGGVRYRDQATQNRFAEQRRPGGIDRDEARGRLGDGGRAGDRPLKAPDLDRVRAEGAAGGRVADLQDRPIRGQGRPDSARDRPATGEARPKAQGKDKAVAKAKPKANAAAADRRPVNQAAKRPAVADSKAQRPSRPEGATARPQRPEARSAPAASGAFKASRPQVDRAASNRGAASRSAAGRGDFGGGARGGGGRSGGGGGGRAGGGGGRGR